MGLRNLFYPILDKIRRPLKIRKEYFNTDDNIILDLGAGDWKRGNLTLDHGLKLQPDICADATVIPLSNQSVDQVVCYHLGEHLVPEQLQKLTSEVHRVLNKNGLFYFLVDRELTEKALFSKDSTHVHRYKEAELIDIVSPYFDIECKQSFNLVGNVNRFGMSFWKYLDKKMKVYFELRRIA